MSLLWLCCSPARPSTRYEFCFPWILSNQNRKLYTISLAVDHSNNWPRLFAAQQSVSDGFAAADAGFKDNAPISSTRATQKACAGDRPMLGNGNKVYAKKGTFEEARITAERRHKISDSHLDNLRSLTEAVDALEFVAESGTKVSPNTYKKLLQSCVDLNCIELGRKLHALMSVVENVDPFVETKLVSMYANCGCLCDARRVFDRMRDRNLFTWSAMIEAYSRAEKWEHVSELFLMMLRHGVIPDQFLFPKILAACGKRRDLEATKVIHSMVVRLGLCGSIRVSTSILAVYANSGKLNWAKKLFEKMEKRNVVSWTALITGFIQEGLIEEGMEVMKNMESLGIAPNVVTWTSMISGLFHNNRRRQALDFFNVMLLEGVEPNAVTISSLVSACASVMSFGKGKEIHAFSIKIGVMDNVHVRNSLIDMYCKCRDLEAAQQVFDTMIKRDVVTWTSMILGLFHDNRRRQALDFFNEMLLEGVEPNAVTISSLVSACASVRSFGKGKEIHAFSIKIGVMDNLHVRNSLIDMYCKCGDLEAAQQVFDTMIERDVYTWSSLIAGYSQAGFCGKACVRVMKMQESGAEPNVITWNAMISGYMCNGHEDLAIDLFQSMGKDGKLKRETTSWNNLMSGYLKLRETEKAFSIFRQMQLNSVVPNMATVLTVLPAFGNLLAAKHVREMHCCILRQSLESKFPVVNSLVDAYAKSGNLRYSKILFDIMQSKDIVTWNSIISGYVSHGFPDLAIGMYDHMRKSLLEPNGGTFLRLIYAYGLSGRVDDGKEAFSSMLEDYHIVPGPEHYSAMVDLLGRAGRLGEAVDLIANMPVEPNLSVWSALLTASRIHRNVSFAVRALDHMLALEPRNYLVQRLRKQINGLVGKSKIELKMGKLERENAAKMRKLGRCRIELEDKVYTFHAGDQSHPYLYPWIHKATRKETSQSGFHDGHCIEEEDNEEVGGVHSEKLALGFALINFPRQMQCIRIVKSLRMCGSCHETIKCVSKLYGHEIFVTDSKRLHRFSDGECSCRDYW